MRFNGEKNYNEERGGIGNDSLVNTNIYGHGKESKSVEALSIGTAGTKKLKEEAKKAEFGVMDS